MASIRDVAKMAGVSPATVSRVMNGTAKVAEEKRRRVQEAIEKTGFKPNAVARTLFTGESRIFGMIVPNIENPFFSELAKVIEETAYNNGYSLTLCSSGNDKQKEKNNIDMLTSMSADGIILLTSSEGILEEIDKTDIPIIVLDRLVSHKNEIAAVHSDNYQGGRLAAQHLIDCGCEEIVCIRGPQDLSSARGRFQGFEDVMKEHGREVHFIDSTYNYEDGLAAGDELIERFPQADGVFCANDMNALGVYKILNWNGKRVPDDIQMVGFDNILLSQRMSPELTTIEQNKKVLGESVVKLLIDYIRGEKVSDVNIYPVRLIQRESTRKKRNTGGMA